MKPKYLQLYKNIIKTALIPIKHNSINCNYKYEDIARNKSNYFIKH